MLILYYIFVLYIYILFLTIYYCTTMFDLCQGIVFCRIYLPEFIFMYSVIVNILCVDMLFQLEFIIADGFEQCCSNIFTPQATEFFS